MQLIPTSYAESTVGTRGPRELLCRISSWGLEASLDGKALFR
jgi:hypothetical protein